MEPKTHKLKFIGEMIQEYAATAVALLYIVNGIATFLIMFNIVETNARFDRIIGAVAFGFSGLALLTFTNHGVKHQQSTKKKGKK